MRANKALRQVGIPDDWVAMKPDSITRIFGGQRTGTSAEVLVRKPEFLTHTRLRLIVKSLDFGNDDRRPIWLDGRRTRAENAPMRALHLMGEVISDWAGDNEKNIKIIRKWKQRRFGMEHKFVSLCVVAGVFKWAWTPRALAMIPVQDRKTLEDAAATERVECAGTAHERHIFAPGRGSRQHCHYRTYNSSFHCPQTSKPSRRYCPATGVQPLASNAACTLQQPGRLQAFLNNVSATVPNWVAIFISEADAKKHPLQHNVSAHKHLSTGARSASLDIRSLDSLARGLPSEF